ncbi:PREDICTED: uncharacterized protein LOC104699037, partial [Camelina sativa]|uniref:Uncharacterized protein LOC104699037 n=1 Tax=Camelina sativa TaxID=90675 RepID=A0ABM0SKX8_CAMSA
FHPKFSTKLPKKPAIDRKTFPPPHTPSPGVVRRLHAPPSSSSSLLKQHSWSPDLIREEAWSKRQDVSRRHRYLRRGKSLTDEDLDELKASFELGFGFGSPEIADQRLSDTLPALELYFAVQKSYNDAVSNKSTTSSSSLSSDGDTSPHSSVYRNSDDPQTVKTKLKQWARVVACTVNQSLPR